MCKQSVKIVMLCHRRLRPRATAARHRDAIMPHPGRGNRCVLFAERAGLLARNADSEIVAAAIGAALIGSATLAQRAATFFNARAKRRERTLEMLKGELGDDRWL